MNVFKTGMLLAELTALFMGIGYMIGGSGGALVAFLFATGMNLVSYWNADKFVLRMHNAHEVDARTAPEYHRLVAELAARAGLPMPKVYLIEDPQPNAFATGRNPQNAAVAATTGLLQQLTREEIAGVMAHELAHVKNRDTLIMTVAATIGGAISMLANFAFFFGGRDEEGNPTGIVPMLAIMLLAPLAAGLVQMAVSRAREYEADRVGAEIAGDPHSLASALRKIERFARGAPNPYATRNPATAHMFIINPLSGRRRDGLFSTHPDTENRVAALMKLTTALGGRPAATAVPVTPRAAGPWG